MVFVLNFILFIQKTTSYSKQSNFPIDIYSEQSWLLLRTKLSFNAQFNDKFTKSYNIRYKSFNIEYIRSV